MEDVTLPPQDKPDGRIPLVAVTGSLPLGGSSTFLVNLAKAFRERELILPIVSLSESNELDAEFVSAGARVISISNRTRIYEDRLKVAYEETARFRPRAVMACLGAESFEVIRLIPPSCFRIGLIQSHDPGPYSISRQYAKWIDAMVGVSTEISRFLKTMPEFSGHRVETIPYGISFKPTVERRVLPADAPLQIIYLGRMAEVQKRVSRLVELVRRLEEHGENVIFTFAGGGAQLPEVKEALAGSRLARFLGEIPNSTVQSLLATQDIFVLLSDFEGLPLTLLEAMGQGVVPVVSDLESGIRDVISESCGIRIRTGDVAAAADAIIRLNADRQRLQLMAQAASKIARTEFNAGRMAGKYLELVESAAGSRTVWPQKVSISAPMGLSPFLFSGLPRIGRRFLKKNFAGVFSRRRV